jgi:hypothetical protein
VIDNELITIEARIGENYNEIWRSDCPHIPPKTRQQEGGNSVNGGENQADRRHA